MSHYTMLSKYGSCTRLVKIKTSWKLVVFTNKVGKNSRYFVGVFKKTISPLTLVGYEMIIANSYPMCTCGKIVKCYIRWYKCQSLTPRWLSLLCSCVWWLMYITYNIPVDIDTKIKDVLLHVLIMSVSMAGSSKKLVCIKKYLKRLL